MRQCTDHPTRPAIAHLALYRDKPLPPQAAAHHEHHLCAECLRDLHAHPRRHVRQRLGRLIIKRKLIAHQPTPEGP